MDGDGKKDSWAVGTYFTKDPLTPTIWQSVLNANGGQLLDGNQRVKFNNPKGVKALQTQIDLLKHAPPGASTYQFNEPLEAFRQGKTATMFMWGSVYKGTAVDKAFTKLNPEDVGITTMPAGSAGPSTHRGVWSAAVAKIPSPGRGVDVPAVDDLEGGREVGRGQSRVLPRTPLHAGRHTPAKWLGPVYETIKKGDRAVQAGKMYRPRLPESDAIQQILSLQTSRAISGETSAKEALNTAAESITTLLRAKGYEQ
ncbi:extracellular solute-binding protein [Streptomyces sp. M10(2022)]